jgi:hypothetical protein
VAQGDTRVLRICSRSASRSTVRALLESDGVGRALVLWALLAAPWACVAGGSSSNKGFAPATGAPGPGCAQPLAAYCDGGGCDPDLATAVARIGCGNYSSNRVTKDCGGFDVLSSSGVDYGSDEYFDSATGKLVALGNAGVLTNGALDCFAGPPDFVVPSCPNAVSVDPCAAAEDAGGADGDSAAGSDGAAGDVTDAPSG